MMMAMTMVLLKSLSRLAQNQWTSGFQIDDHNNSLIKIVSRVLHLSLKQLIN